MNRTLPLLAAAALAALALTGCASSGSSSSAANPPPPTSLPSGVSTAPPPSAAPSSDLSSPTPSTTAQMVAACTSHSCLTQEAEATLPGEQASDGSVITKATCDQSSVKHSAPGIFTVSCKATYTDGSVWRGLATIQPAADQFSWQPQNQLS